MGVIKLSFQLVFYTAVFAAVVLFIPGLPPHLEFENRPLPPRQKLEGKLAPNNILDKAELFIDGIEGPESIAQRGDEVYTGIAAGWIVKVVKGKLINVVRLGNCHSGNPLDCGRPWGIRFNKEGKLLVADMNLGIIKVDVDLGTSEIIFSKNGKIEGGKPPNFPNDLDIDKEGNIYWSDVSEEGSPYNLGVLLLGPATGRLMKFDPKTKKSVILVDKLWFANGVQLSKNEDFVTVAETFGQRVTKYYLKGEKKGKKEILIDNLPGFPDNIRSNGKGGFYITLEAARETKDGPNGIEIVAPMPQVKKLILRLQYLALTFLNSIKPVLSYKVFKSAENYVASLPPLLSETFAPTRVIIVEVDENGKILGSLQTKDGQMTQVSEASRGDKFTYFGSPMTTKLWRIKTDLL